MPRAPIVDTPVNHVPRQSSYVVGPSRWRLFANTWLVTALNPKGIAFFVAFLPQFVTPGADVTRQLWLLAVTFVVMAIANATLYTVFAAAAHRMLSSPQA